MAILDAIIATAIQNYRWDNFLAFSQTGISWFNSPVRTISMFLWKANCSIFSLRAYLLALRFPCRCRMYKAPEFERNLSINATTAAKVQSWNSQNMAAYDSGSSGGGPIGNQGSSTANLPFLFSGANYTSQQVTDLAKRYTAELGRLSTVLNLDMPWDLSLSPRATILLNDTNSLFDTTYLIDSIERHYSPTSGSKQLVRANQI